MNWYRIGSYICTVNSAGWLVLFAVTEVPLAFATSALWAAGTILWNVYLLPAEQLPTPRRKKPKSEDK